MSHAMDDLDRLLIQLHRTIGVFAVTPPRILPLRLSGLFSWLRIEGSSATHEFYPECCFSADQGC
jgi:hypothetical protein